MASKISDTITIRLPKTLKRYLETLADIEQVPMSVLVRHMISEGVADRERQAAKGGKSNASE